MEKLSHIDENGRAIMVNVSGKAPQQRTAVASGKINLAPATLEKINSATVKKGDVLTVAQIAGIQAAKRTSDLIPLCHPLTLDHVEVTLKLVTDGVEVTSRVQCTGRTGVEMEALTAVSVACLTVYDMCKAVDSNMLIGEIKLLEKTKV